MKSDLNALLYSCVVTDCSESWQHSLHKTVKGAYKSGNAWLNRQHNQSFESRKLIGKQHSDFMGCYYRFRVIPVQVQE